jgi:uncharacterized membrane protein
MSRSTASRLPGIDIARGVAVLGMFVIHVLPQGEGRLTDLIVSLNLGERPRTLFAVVGGVALGLFVASLRRRSDLDDSAIRRIVAVRAVALLALGLYLQTMASGVSVVLDTWGLVFLCFLPLLRVPARWLAALALALFVLGIVVEAGSAGWPPRLLAAGGVFSQLVDWLASGSYPLPLWVAFVAVGYLLAGFDVTRGAVQAGMVAAGGAAFVTGYVLGEYGLTAGTLGAGLTAHVSALGAAVAVVGGLVWASGWRPVRVALWPLGSIGPCR